MTGLRRLWALVSGDWPGARFLRYERWWGLLARSTAVVTAGLVVGVLAVSSACAPTARTCAQAHAAHVTVKGCR